MKNIDFKKALAGLAVTGMCLAFSACEKEAAEDGKDGKAAAVEFCNCMESHTKDYCFDKLKDNYKNYSAQAFIDAFNKANPCDATLYWETTGAAYSGKASAPGNRVLTLSGMEE